MLKFKPREFAYLYYSQPIVIVGMVCNAVRLSFSAGCAPARALINALRLSLRPRWTRAGGWTPGTVSRPRARLLVPRRLNPSVLGACFGGGAKTPQVRAKAGALSPFVLNPSRCGQNLSPSSRPRCTPQPPPVLTGFSASFSLGEDSYSGGEGKGARGGPS